MSNASFECNKSWDGEREKESWDAYYTRSPLPCGKESALQRRGEISWKRFIALMRIIKLLTIHSCDMKYPTIYYVQVSEKI